MSDFKQIVKQCQQLVAKSELSDSLLPLWNSIEFQAHAEDSGTAALDRRNVRTIHLYPALKNDPSAHKRVLREFGSLVLHLTGTRGESLWRIKADVPTAEQIAMAKSKLTDSELRKACKRYQDVLDNYPSKGGSVDRLVFVNIANALLANNVTYPDSVGVDITTWGPTAEYCQLKKYHTLVPLVSAYAPADVYADYGHALAAMLVDNLGSVRDSSVAYALRGLVQRIAKAAASAD